MGTLHAKMPDTASPFPLMLWRCRCRFWYVCDFRARATQQQKNRIENSKISSSACCGWLAQTRALLHFFSWVFFYLLFFLKCRACWLMPSRCYLNCLSCLEEGRRGKPQKTKEKWRADVDRSTHNSTWFTLVNVTHGLVVVCKRARRMRSKKRNIIMCATRMTCVTFCNNICVLALSHSV